MSRLFLVLTIALTTVFAACEDGTDILVIDESGSVYLVSNNADEGEGSLRAALEAANTDPAVNTIQVEAGVGTIALASALTYSGEQSLRILGNGVVIDGSECVCDLLVAPGGADLDLVDLTLANGENGLRVAVPSSRSGNVGIRLIGVRVENNGLHGVWVDDGDAAAGLDVEIISSFILGNGFIQGASDYDGVRVEEGGAGTLTFVTRDTEAGDNAGDGVDLREAGTGDLYIDVRDSDFGNNGEQPQNLDAPEDGFDAREVGSGSIDVRFVSSTASGNHARGVFLAEEGAGDIRGALTGVVASDNGAANLLLREDADAEGGAVPGAGGISVTFSQVTAEGSGEDGARIEELGAGDLVAQIQDSDFSDNDGDGLGVIQGGTGKGTLHLVRVNTDGNGGSPVSTEGTFVTDGDDQTTTVLVRNNEDTGFGSLRAALEMANLDEGIVHLLFEPGIAAIRLKSTLEYTGSQDLQITAEGALVDAEDCECDALVVSGSGNLTVSGLSFEDAAENGLLVTGGGDLTLRNLLLRNMEGNGLLMDVHEDAEGVVTVILDGVLVENNGLHGVFIDDLAPVFGPGTGASSAAGILLRVEGSTIQQNGYRQDVTDRDGVRIDEGGLGDIEVQITDSGILNNAGDGVELNEEDLGAIQTDILGSQINTNGRQPQNPDDLEDGLDISELGPGDVRVWIRESFVRDNFARGFGLEESGSGDVWVTLEVVSATGNDERNLTIIEDLDARSEIVLGSGSLLLSFTQVTVTGGGVGGIVLEENGVGNLTGQLIDSTVRQNAGIGIHATQTPTGSGQLQLVRVFMSQNTGGNLVTDGVGVATVPGG